MVVSACLYAEYHGDSCSHSWYDLDSDAGVGLVWFGLAVVQESHFNNQCEVNGTNLAPL